MNVLLIAMKLKLLRTFSIAAIIFVAVGLVGACAYTRLAPPETRPNPSGPMSDLSAEAVNSTLHIVQFADSPDKRIEATFTVRIKNEGDTSFIGTLFIRWKDRPNEPADDGHQGQVKPCRLAPGDSIDLTVSHGYPLNQPRTLVRFTVLTDDRSIDQNDAAMYHCGAFPVREKRYDNNDGMVTLFTDSLHAH